MNKWRERREGREGREGREANKRSEEHTAEKCNRRVGRNGVKDCDAQVWSLETYRGQDTAKASVSSPPFLSLSLSAFSLVLRRTSVSPLLLSCSLPFFLYLPLKGPVPPAWDANQCHSIPADILLFSISCKLKKKMNRRKQKKEIKGKQ